MLRDPLVVILVVIPLRVLRHPKRRGEKIEKNRMARQKSPSHSIFFKEL
jgi:hypothetical protein